MASSIIVFLIAIFVLYVNARILEQVAAGFIPNTPKFLKTLDSRYTMKWKVGDPLSLFYSEGEKIHAKEMGRII